jgi:hypothetical protein
LIVNHGASLAVKGEPQAVRSTLDSKLAHDSVVIKQKWKREVRRSHLFLMIRCDFAMQVLSAGIIGVFWESSTMSVFGFGHIGVFSIYLHHASF